MLSTSIVLQRYDADEGKVFDWVVPHFDEDGEGNQIQQHLYTKTLFLAEGDNIANYIEVEM